MNSIGALNGTTRRQGIDYPLLTIYLPFTHQLLSRRVEAGCQLPVTGCRMQVKQTAGDWKKASLPLCSGYQQPMAALLTCNRYKIKARRRLLYNHLNYRALL